MTKLTIENYRSFSSDHPLTFVIEDGITAFIGANNSGKSFALRSLFELRNLFALLADVSNIVRRNHEVGFNFQLSGDPSEIFFNGNEGALRVILENSKVRVIAKVVRPSSAALFECYVDGNIIPEQSRIAENKLHNPSGEIVADVTDLLEDIGSIREAIYVPAFRNTINIGANQNYFDISVGTAFIDAWHEFKTSNQPKIRQKASEVQDDLRELFGYRHFEIIPSPQKQQLFVRTNDHSHPITDLGSGISQFILVFINAAVRNPSFLLIDEPELNLHPKLQIDFINRLLRYTKRGIVFSTHSMGLAHTIANRVYSVSKNPDESSMIRPYEKTSHFSEFLGELNFSNYPPLGYKKVLLVEGVTDVPVFSIFLRKLGKYQDVLIWPLGGGAMINDHTAQQLSELRRLGDDVKFFSWIDSEKTSDRDTIGDSRTSFKSVAKAQKVDVTISERRSIENYFPLEKIQKINPTISSMTQFSELPTTWDKGSNWRVAQEIEMSEIAGTDLETFLKALCA